MEEAALVQQVLASGRPLFSSCQALSLGAKRIDNCLLARQLLAGQSTALQDLTLRVDPDDAQQQQQRWSGEACHHDVCGVLSLPAVRHLRRLSITLPAFGTCSAQQVAQLVHLTELGVEILEDEVVAAAADLTALSGLVSLKRLTIDGPPAVQPAASSEGPFALPHSLTYLEVNASSQPLGCWVMHLPGCPQLQELVLTYGTEQHPSAHPSAVVPLLAQHTPHLRTFVLKPGPEHVTWGAHVPGLAHADAGAAAGADVDWQPDAALAALTGLQCLSVNGHLCVQSAADWQYLVQLTGLTKLSGVMFLSPPDLLPEATSLLELEVDDCSLGVYKLQRVLLACPRLLKAQVQISPDPIRDVPPAGAPHLSPHPSLKTLVLECDHVSGHNAADAAAAVAAHFAGLAPVLSAVPELHLLGWPDMGTPAQDFNASLLPDLSACTALTALEFTVPYSRVAYSVVEEDIRSMLAPLKQLQRLKVVGAPRLDARAVVALQDVLPRLQHVKLRRCGGVRTYGRAVSQEQLLAAVRLLLRPDLLLEVESTLE
jgi:hypothetical protein